VPETVAAWIATNTLTATSVLTAAQITTLTYTAFAVASIGYGNHQRRKQQRAARDAFNASVSDRLVMTATAQAARSRVYGRVRNVDGVLFKQTHGANSEFYTLVIALAGHQVDAIEEIWFDDKPVTLDLAGNVTSAPYSLTTRESLTVTMPVSSGSGSVVLPGVPVAGTTPVAVFTTNPGSDSATDITLAGSLTGTTFSVSGAPIDGDWRVQFQLETTSSKARVRAYTGAPGQNLYPDLQPLVGSAVQTSDRFEGIACLLVTLQFDQDAFPGGVPSISAVMRGARVFDPRTSTTAWTENPALIARDWALYAYGGGCVTAELNEPAFAAAANACDVSTTFALPSGGPVVLPLYQCGIVIPLDSNPDEALSEICEAMAGQWGWAGGRLSVRAGAYRAPVASITEDWVTSAEAIQVTPGATTADAVNIMRPTYADAAQGWVQTPGPEVRADSYVAADGRDLPTELQLGGVTRAVHAQHVCGVLLREAREGLTLTLPCNLRAYSLELFDVVSVTLPRFGWAGKLFEVMGWRFSLTGGVLLTLRETAAAIYTPDAVFDLLNTSPNTGLPRPAAPPAIAGLAATSGGVAQVDGSSMARIRVTWDAVASEAVRQSGSIEVQVAEVYGGLPTGDWPTIAPLAGRAVAADVFGQRIGRLVAIRARAVNTLGMRSPWRQITHLVSGRRAPIIWRQADPPGAGVSQDNDEWLDSDNGERRYVRLAGVWVDARDAGIATAQAAASAAAAAAAAAQGGADTANATLASIASDSLLTPDEKPRVILDRDVIVAEQPGISAQALNYAVTTEKTAYEAAVTALVAYLATLTTPVAWDNLAGNTTIVGATFRGKFADVYTTRQAVLDKINANAKARLGALATLNSVDTGQIASGAATQILTIPTSTSTYPKGDRGGPVLVDGVEFTPSVDSVAEVTMKVDASLTSTSTGDWGIGTIGIACQPPSALTSLGDGEYLFDVGDLTNPNKVQATSSMNRTRAAYTLAARFSVLAGTTYRIGCYWKGDEPGVGIFYEPVIHKAPDLYVTLIKR
jgi:hypothetical protein